MKLHKILYFILAALVFVACDDDEMKVNSANGTTVEFGADTLKAREGQVVATIPVVCSGDMNGKVKVTIEVTQAVDTDEPAIEDVHYYVATKTIWIYPDEKEANFEITAVDDSEMNADRTFILTITGVEGATLGARSQVVGLIADNDSKPYDRLCRAWNMKAVDGDDKDMDVAFEMLGYPSDDFRYERMLQAAGNWGYGVDTLDLQYKSTGGNNGFVTLLAGSNVARNLYFGASYGYCDLKLAVSKDNSYVLSGGIQGNWNADFTEVTFGDQAIGVVVVTTADNSVVGPNTLLGGYDQWSNITFVAAAAE